MKKRKKWVSEVRAELGRRGMSQKELAEELGVGVGYIRNALGCGYTQPCRPLKIKICNFLGITLPNEEPQE